MKPKSENIESGISGPEPILKHFESKYLTLLQFLDPSKVIAPKMFHYLYFRGDGIYRLKLFQNRKSFIRDQSLESITHNHVLVADPYLDLKSRINQTVFGCETTMDTDRRFTNIGHSVYDIFRDYQTYNSLIFSGTFL